MLNNFTQNYLRPDLILVLKLLATNVNAMVVSELTKRLWDTYLRSNKKFDLKQLDLDDLSDTPGFPKSIDDDDDDNVKRDTIFFPNTNRDNLDSESKQLISNSPAISVSKRPPSNS